jgi:hypothetical protein
MQKPQRGTGILYREWRYPVVFAITLSGVCNYLHRFGAGKLLAAVP